MRVDEDLQDDLWLKSLPKDLGFKTAEVYFESDYYFEEANTPFLETKVG